VKFEQKEIGNPEYGCALSPIDFVTFAKACGADAFRCERPDEVRSAISAALNSSKAALVEALVDAEEKPTHSLVPLRSRKQAGRILEPRFLKERDRWGQWLLRRGFADNWCRWCNDEQGAWHDWWGLSS